MLRLFFIQRCILGLNFSSDITGCVTLNKWFSPSEISFLRKSNGDNYQV